MIETLVTPPFFFYSFYNISEIYKIMKWSNYSETRYSNQMRIENQQNNSCLKKTRCVLTPQMPPQGAKFQMPNLV